MSVHKIVSVITDCLPNVSSSQTALCVSSINLLHSLPLPVSTTHPFLWSEKKPLELSALSIMTLVPLTKEV